MAATLETLPRECLEETLLYLDARDVVAAMATSRTVRQVAGGERVWRELAFRDFGVCEPAGEETAPASTPEGDAREGARWRALHRDVHIQLCKDDLYLTDTAFMTVDDNTPYDARCPGNEMRALRARGVFCDGGVDENDPENWFGQVFELEGAGHRFYCSAASSDVHLVGCFAEGDVHCAWRADAGRHSRRRFMAAKCSLLAHVLERLSAQSSLAPADQRDFETILRESRALPPYDFTAWPHEELGSFFSHYVSHYRSDDPISQLFFDKATPYLHAPFPHHLDDSSRDGDRVQREMARMRRFGIDVLREVAELHRKDQLLEGRLHDSDFPLTHVEPLPEAEYRLFEYLFDRQPDNEHFSYSDPTPLALRAKDDASAKRRAETPGRELLDLFAENAAMHAFSDAVVRVDGRELDDRLELWNGPVWRAARRRGGAAVAEGASSGQGETREEVSEASENAERPSVDRFGLEDVEDHAGCAHFSGGDTALRTIGPPLCLDPDDPDAVWFVGKPRAETRAETRAAGAVGADDAAATHKGSAFWERLPYAAGVRRWRKLGAVVSALEIDRAGAFTCPVSAGAVFFSTGPPARLAAAARAALRAAAPAGAPPMSGDARAAALGDWARNAVCSPRAATARLRGIDTLAKLEAAARDGAVPAIAKVTTFPNGVVAEFEPPARPRRRGARMTSSTFSSTSSTRNRTASGGKGADSYSDAAFDPASAYDAFAPAVWFRFHARESLDPATRADPHRDVLHYRLARPRWSRAHCVKLIAPENLMREWEDDHPAPNLDFRRFVAFGAPLALSDHEVGGRAFVSSAEPGVFVRTPGVAYSDDEEEGEAEEDSD